jgi:hypothetical protein
MSCTTCCLVFADTTNTFTTHIGSPATYFNSRSYLETSIHCGHHETTLCTTARSSQAPQRNACSKCICSRSEAAALGGSTTSHIATLRKNMGFLSATALRLHFNSLQNNCRRSARLSILCPSFTLTRIARSPIAVLLSFFTILKPHNRPPFPYSVPCSLGQVDMSGVQPGLCIPKLMLFALVVFTIRPTGGADLD